MYRTSMLILAPCLGKDVSLINSLYLYQHLFVVHFNFISFSISLPLSSLFYNSFNFSIYESHVQVHENWAIKKLLLVIQYMYM